MNKQSFTAFESALNHFNDGKQVVVFTFKHTIVCTNKAMSCDEFINICERAIQNSNVTFRLI